MSAAAAAPAPPILYKCPKGAVDLTGSTADRITDLSRLAERIFRSNGGTLLETPVFERTDLLLGKYGEEAETKLIYRLADQGGEDLALRYDLTVPFVRYVRENGIKKMRRYSIGKVYRRDQPNPGQGRLREFYQADFDILGGAQEGMMAEATLLAMGAEFFDAALIPATIFVNDVRNLRTLLTRVGIPAADVRRLTPVIDKLDKQTFEMLVPEFVAASSVLAAEPVLLVALRAALESPDPVDADSLGDWVQLLEGMDALGVAHTRLVWSNSLARGLDYYTGFMWEVKVNNGTGSSVAAGGRYDGLLGTPTCGISFGISRIASLVPVAPAPPIPLNICLVTTVGAVSVGDKLCIVRALRNPEYGFDGVVYDFTSVDRKLGKVLSSADTRFVAIVTETEWAAARIVILRDLSDRTERRVCITSIPIPSGGEGIRTYLLDRMRGILGPEHPLPICWSMWESVPSDERSLLRKMWMVSERADWDATLCARAVAEGISGSYVALGNGRIVGYYSDSEEAIEASTNAIRTTIGTIGISVIRQIPGVV